MNTLHVFGDSHTTYFTGDRTAGQNGGEYVDCGTDELRLRVMKLSNTGPTLRGLLNPNSRTKAGVRARQEITSEGAKHVMFVLGEVDCREHLTKPDVDPDTEAAKTIERFEQFRQTLPDVETLGLFGVCPPQRDLVRGRKLWTLPAAVACLNDRLRHYCVANNHRFVSIYQDVVDNCGFLDPRFELSDGLHVHLRPALVKHKVMRRLAETYLK